MQRCLGLFIKHPSHNPVCKHTGMWIYLQEEGQYEEEQKEEGQEEEQEEEELQEEEEQQEEEQQYK